MQGTGIRPPRCRSASHCCGHAGHAHGSTGAQPGMLKGKSRCPGTRISLPSLPEPSTPSLAWGPFTPSCLSFPPAHSDCSNISPASGPHGPMLGKQHIVPSGCWAPCPAGYKWLLFAPWHPALPRPLSGFGQEVSLPRPTNWLEQLPVPHGDCLGQQGARLQTQLICAPVPSQGSHCHPQPQLCPCPAACVVGLAELGL